MIHIKRLINMILIILVVNIVAIIDQLDQGPVMYVIAISGMTVFYIKYNIIPIVQKSKSHTTKLVIMIGGCELMMNACVLIGLQIIIYVIALTGDLISVGSPLTVTLNAVISVLALLLILLNGIIRILLTSSQVGVAWKVLLVLTWWIPVVNVIVFIRCCRMAKREYLFEVSKIELNNQRVENEVCKTKYPILMVHGIFWRDWQWFNYWGRIPCELIRNGAKVFYGHQHSAASMDVCGHELKEQIRSIIEEEQCEKVHIIAHSKGGLDARYVVSCLEMDAYVASLTTIGTPHKGSLLVDWMIQKLPEKLVKAVAGKYNAAYRRLGDETPDFYTGVIDLTTEKCRVFNEVAVNKDGVVYQSYGSKMTSMLSAGFPLNFGYMILKRLAGDNDGFVSIASSKHGNYLGEFHTKKQRGVSHGDMIDLMRENIKGFDVCECYVGILRDLKERGM